MPFAYCPLLLPAIMSYSYAEEGARRKMPAPPEIRWPLLLSVSAMRKQAVEQVFAGTGFC
jgi:hypothetical protein